MCIRITFTSALLSLSCVRACVRACVRVCVRACVRVCVVCVRVCVFSYTIFLLKPFTT